MHLALVAVSSDAQPTHFVEMEDQIQFTDVLKRSIQRFDEHLDSAQNSHDSAKISPGSNQEFQAQTPLHPPQSCLSAEARPEGRGQLTQSIA